ncbi:hypothetical protein B0T24DRAFT_649069 [Lasiosphaeria ovina]|uniref:Heparinase II/III-like C-terminal domain-containing protein n=1 Tax=Lasiosphaeria ovina TaxID=92902 RepID=A0AAE0N7B2_9PEZI|nr:hypothetical protein B0T24DRAFT_649069 [Lasiosphaeria ovina]
MSTGTTTAWLKPQARKFQRGLFVFFACTIISLDSFSSEGKTWEVITDHPRLFTTPQRWINLPQLIAEDPYMARWNDTIFGKAVDRMFRPPENYSVDGTSGVLDVAREVQLRIKHWAYAYRMSDGNGDSVKWRWKERIWMEIVVASGNSSEVHFGKEGDNWNSEHWLDVGEFLVAFAYAYDWLYDAWSLEERTAIMWSMINLGLKKGLEAHESGARFLGVEGNWNCVTNGGMIIGALTIYHDDPTGVAKELLPRAIANVVQNCAQSVSSDGTWTETPDCWYFGTQAHAQIASALLSATGSTHGLLTASKALQDTGMFHMYSYGMTDKFNYGDCGPNKITATANALMFYGNVFSKPIYTLYQRDKTEAADPLAMLWYNQHVSGNWYHELPLHREFPDRESAWVSMRSTWADPSSGLFVAVKAGRMVDGNLDAGDFVLDAMGERWAGELCQDDYSAPLYFSSEAQDSPRWRYYRCRTAGQNTLLYNGQNQIADAPLETTRFGSRGKEGGASWMADLTNAYNGTSITRGLRTSVLGSGASWQVLIQDEIKSTERPSQWRMHTNASIAYSQSGKRAHLRLGAKEVVAMLLSPKTASFHTAGALRQPTDPPLPSATNDMENAGVRVLAIDIPSGNSTVSVLFCPLWTTSTTCDGFLGGIVPIADWDWDSAT